MAFTRIGLIDAPDAAFDLVADARANILGLAAENAIYFQARVIGAT